MSVSYKIIIECQMERNEGKEGDVTYHSTPTTLTPPRPALLISEWSFRAARPPPAPAPAPVPAPDPAAELDPVEEVDGVDGFPTITWVTDLLVNERESLAPWVIRRCFRVWSEMDDEEEGWLMWIVVPVKIWFFFSVVVAAAAAGVVVVGVLVIDSSRAWGWWSSS